MESANELWLVRHGETEWSASGRHTSFTDLALTDKGRQAAIEAGRRLAGIEFARVLASPLLRARETCSLAGFGSRAEITGDLHEWRYGEDEGRTTAEIREQRPLWSIWTDGAAGGETPADIGARADRFIATVRESEGRVLAFAHAHISRVIAARWISHPVADGAVLKLDTAAISVLAWDRDGAVLRLWNDIGRLPA
ncbi:MAG TPA: histidine phosphatase family protein [Candidatus Binatia bacterium]|jgi:probable phosphoglycerate mutase